MTRLPWKPGQLQLHAGSYFVSVVRLTYATRASLLRVFWHGLRLVMRTWGGTRRGFVQLLCGALLLASGSVLSTPLPVATVEPDAVCHQSLQDAAIAALLAAVAKSRRVEYGGAVFQRGPSCFVHSIPVTNNLPSRLEYKIRSVHGHRVVGIFHTHTPGRYANVFSEGDIAVQRRLRMPSYVGTLDSRGRGVTIRSLSGTGEGDFVRFVEPVPLAAVHSSAVIRECS
jgi:hypothetical protein